MALHQRRPDCDFIGASYLEGPRIAGVEYLKKRIGFLPYAFHKGPVFHGVLARGLKFSPQALDEGQTLAAVI